MRRIYDRIHDVMDAFRLSDIHEDNFAVLQGQPRIFDLVGFA
jgi:hypothetical protein